MIYPRTFPVEKRGHPEHQVYQALKQVSDTYDIFYNQRFHALSNNEKKDYEIDFIIAKPGEVLLILEVKGGGITFNGLENEWLQNGRPFKVEQPLVHCKQLINRYDRLAKMIPFEWAFCFPECSKDPKAILPNAVSEACIIDRSELQFLTDVLEKIFNAIIERYGNKKHPDAMKEYHRFKASMVKPYGFIQTLASHIEADEAQFIKLTARQKEIIDYTADESRIIVEGVAGSGKTLIAQNLALENSEQGKSVLFICFNRTLANVVKQKLKGFVQCTVDTFHHYAETRIGEVDPNWFAESNNGSVEFFEEDIPLKFSDVQDVHPREYDLIIIDEGQDFSEYWLDLIFSEVKANGRINIFMDRGQDIFKRFKEIPEAHTFKSVMLLENCRNTQAITEYINTTLDKQIRNREGTPVGEDVVRKEFETLETMISAITADTDKLINDKDHKLKTNQILLLVEGSSRTTQLNEIKQLGDFPLKVLPENMEQEKGTIYFTSTKKFKGLDADVVFAISEDPNHPISPENKYVLMSRAKHRLFIYNNLKKELE